MGAASITMNDGAAARPAVNPWIIAIAVTLATFMEVLDTSIANVALPHIAGSLSAGQDESTWVLTSYLVSNAIVLPLSGWLSSIFGRKRFTWAVSLCSRSARLCGFAPNLPMLIISASCRGAEGITTQRTGDLADTFPAKRGWPLRFMARRWWWLGHRPDAGRMDHRQFQLALDFLCQHPGWNSFPAVDVASDSGPARIPASQVERNSH
jgi:hypothetical protein